MKDQILKLRAEGKTYKEIQMAVGCSKSTVCYYCGDGQKEKNAERTRRRRKDVVIAQCVERFQYRLKNKSEDFQRDRYRNEKGMSRLGKGHMTFSWRDVIKKYGWETTCYLTGRVLNLRQPRTYHFDHKVPYSKGGSSNIDNLGITCREANLAKSNLTIEEFLQICKEVLEFNGYRVEKLEG